ncbi:branched-chain amino acid ABC transporter substrate-binding protein, partial [Micromonospora sp. NPDC048843]
MGMRRTMGVAAASAVVVLAAGCGGGGPQSSGDQKLTGDKIVLGV